MPYERTDNVWVSVTVEMNLNRMEYSRSRYTFFDLLSDIGGLKGMFAEIFLAFVVAWNFNAIDNFMVTKLYKVKSENNGQIIASKANHSLYKNMKMSRYPYCKEYLMSWVSCIPFCNRQNRNERAFQKARD